MDVLFVSLHYRENSTYCRIGRLLEQQAVSCHYVSLSRYSRRLMKKEDVDLTLMPDLLDATREVVRLDEGTITEAERRYGLVSLRQLYLADRGLKGDKEISKAYKAMNYLLAWEDYFNNHHVDAVITDIGGELIRRTVFCAASSRGIPCIFISWAPFPNSLTLGASDFYYMDKLELAERLSESEKKDVDDYINVFNKKSDVFVFNPPLRVSAGRIRHFLKDFFISVFFERCSHEHFRKVQHALRFSRRLINKHFIGALYDRPNFGEKYFYFPLHAYDDFQLTVRARHCLDQGYIAGLCADALPYGYKLYVKEHPGFVGEGSYSTLRRISRRENVVLLPANMNSHLIVKNSCGVITINSTVGFEALLHFKPVITLGYSFYRGYGLTIDVDNFFDLPAAVKRSLSFRPDRERLYSFIHAAMNSTFPGDYIGDESEENIRKVSKSLLRRLRKSHVASATLQEAVC